ncbi:MAG: hypothetical protein NDI61_05155 [Bdellovibrionaceae bacterium]|nr:hypothetical protein [Pseudobdellovibrionaceae bacterium]
MRRSRVSHRAWLLGVSVGIYALGTPSSLATSTLNSNCKQNEFSCGECETALQDDFNELLNEFSQNRQLKSPRWSDSQLPRHSAIKSDAKIEDFIEKSIALLKKHNPDGANRLNMIMLGHSESLHGTTPGNPRVALKSPDGELWVTFNTDPKAPGYNSVEVMRWDGKTGTYKFQEIAFPDAKVKQGHIDLSGSKCVRCHREPMRPNWDTYRSWAGVVPPRDDLLENTKDKNSESKVTGPDSNARAYFNFLDRIAKAKEGKAQPQDARLKMLEIPANKPKPTGSPTAQIGAIKSELAQKGFYRVPHFPERDQLRNHSPKTAPKAGSSHVAFDQFMGQQLCQIATGLKQNRNFDKFKYALTGIMRCSASPKKDVDFTELRKYLPDDFDARARAYFSQSSSLNTEKGQTPIANQPDSVLQAVFEHTKKAHEEGDQYKTSRHENYISNYLQIVEKVPKDKAKKDSHYVSSKKLSKVGLPFTAIEDPGGVKGVAESDTGLIASMRYILEPYGVNVDAWSMALGRSVTDRTFSFSDQFADTLGQQALWDEVMSAVPGKNQTEKCKALQDLSRQSLQEEQASQPTSELPDICKTDGSLFLEKIELESTASRLVENTCMTCHGSVAPPLDLNFSDHSATRNWLNQPHPTKPHTWAKQLQFALSSEYSLAGLPEQMPPRGWNYDPPVNGLEKAKRDKVRRDLINGYINFISQPNPDGTKFTCQDLKFYLSAEAKNTNPSTAPIQSPGVDTGGENEPDP